MRKSTSESKSESKSVVCGLVIDTIGHLNGDVIVRLSVNPLSPSRDLKQQYWRRLRKRHLEKEFGLLQTLSRLFQPIQLVKCWLILLELNSKRLYQS